MTHRDFEMTEEERAREKKIRRENIKEAIALIIAVPLFVLLFWLFLVGTPNQSSAEADMAAEAARPDAAAEATCSDMGQRGR